MSTVEAYDIKLRKKVSMKNPQPYLMKNGTWALKGISAETGIKLFKMVGKTKPEIIPVSQHSQIYLQVDSVNVKKYANSNFLIIKLNT